MVLPRKKITCWTSNFKYKNREFCPSGQNNIRKVFTIVARVKENIIYSGEFEYSLLYMFIELKTINGLFYTRQFRAFSTNNMWIKWKYFLKRLSTWTQLRNDTK